MAEANRHTGSHSPIAAPRDERTVTIPLDRIDAVVFDMDGVVTDTAVVHAAAWKRLFDEYLEERAAGTDDSWKPFVQQDYLSYVDGKPRYDGVRSFLQSRGIELPEGDPSDPPDRETVYGLGNRKDGYFLAELRRGGARAFSSTVALVGELTAAGVRTAIVSASRNMSQVLEAAGVADLFPVRVDGLDSDRLRLRGKPDPAIFLEAAGRLGVDPSRAAVVEDALAGVEAGRRGKFALVIAVDRTGRSQALREAGADVVVSDLGEVRLAEGPASPDPESPKDGRPRIRDLPPALDHLDEIAALIRGRRLAVFLDYDGTLTPIVDDPARALLPALARRALERLAASVPVVVMSGRDLGDVRTLVGLPTAWYAGSHGFEIVGPGGERFEKHPEFLPSLDAAEHELREAVGTIPGAPVERKRFAVAVHYRQVEEDRVPSVAAAVERVAIAHGDLRASGGKKVFELRPAVHWDKGRALDFLLETLGLDRPDVLPLYIGDDETDEDAFRVVQDRGLGVVVRGEEDERATYARYSLADPGDVPPFLEVVASQDGPLR
jgi:trehalose 6-phosphate phosphatase